MFNSDREAGGEWKAKKKRATNKRNKENTVTARQPTWPWTGERPQAGALEHYSPTKRSRARKGQGGTLNAYHQVQGASPREPHGLRGSLKHARPWAEPVRGPVAGSSVGAWRDAEAGPPGPPGRRTPAAARLPTPAESAAHTGNSDVSAGAFVSNNASPLARRL